ncbi:hypothetical protein EBN03_23300 [Nocardia stercoris]|uniref:Uncharacterized protein n=1 Tax=Nocardia stercoris TaxID=2483361 RepID=A0A3M2KY22_9NOCA|nr:hypothetical protein EBN03_23300 [Nocardia stercoris]
MQAVAAAAIVGYFLRHRDGESVAGSLVASALGGLGLITGLVLMVGNYPTLTGSDATWVDIMPWTLPVVAAAGAIAAGRRRKADADS